jgi:hypothetical protein
VTASGGQAPKVQDPARPEPEESFRFHVRWGRINRDIPARLAPPGSLVMDAIFRAGLTLNSILGQSLPFINNHAVNQL